MRQKWPASVSHETHHSFGLAHSLASRAMGKPAATVGRCSTSPMGRSTGQGTEASFQQTAQMCQVREWGTSEVDGLWAPFKPSEDCGPANILSITPGETLSQNYLAKPLLDSWTTEMEWDYKCFLFEATKLRANLLWVPTLGKTHAHSPCLYVCTAHFLKGSFFLSNILGSCGKLLK